MPNGGVDRATALPSSLAGPRLTRNTLPVAPVQRFVGQRCYGFRLKERYFSGKVLSQNCSCCVNRVSELCHFSLGISKNWTFPSPSRREVRTALISPVLVTRQAMPLPAATKETITFAGSLPFTTSKR